jgi:hypothetical protein
VTNARKAIPRKAENSARRPEGKPGKRKAPKPKGKRHVSDMERIAERQASRVD